MNVTILITKILKDKSLENLTNDELHFLAKILKVKQNKGGDFFCVNDEYLDDTFSSKYIKRNILFTG